MSAETERRIPVSKPGIDASTIRTAVILYQMSIGGGQLLALRIRCSSTNKNRISLVDTACEEWRNLLVGHKVFVETDHQALIYLKNIKFWNALLYLWNLEPKDIDIEVQYIPRVFSIVVDALSRAEQPDERNTFSLHFFQLVPWSLGR